jgi:hypothetical protein
VFFFERIAEMKRAILSLFVFALAVHADTTQSLTFGDRSYVNLDSGQSSTLGSGTWDIYFSTSEGINPQGAVKISNVGVRTAGQFDLLTESDIKLRLASLSARNIPPANLVANDVF